jgi:glycosyltransferase involved in cell wall biosynthesis
MVLLEAMSCGVPCVSFDCPYGPRNIIQNEEDGLLVDYLNSQALAKGICRLIEDKELRKRLGARARENILRFSKERVILQWKNFLYGL